MNGRTDNESVAEVREWWLAEGGHAEGPFGEPYVTAGLLAGTLPPTRQACQVGGEEWLPLSRWEPFARIAPPAPPPTQSAARTAAQPPWNPVTIFWLGFLFTPLWAAITAGLNNRRLGLEAPSFRPAVSVLTWLGINHLLRPFFGWDSLWFDLASMGVAMVILYVTDLDRQEQVFAGHTTGRASLWVPGLAGSPLAVLLVGTILLEATTPSTPREVVLDYWNAPDATVAKQYVTVSMHPLMSDFQAIEGLAAELGLEDDGEDLPFELAADYPMPAEVGGHAVDFQWLLEDPETPTESTLVEGFFHLVDRDGEWRIDGWYATAIDGERGEPRSMTFLTQAILSEMRAEERRQNRGSEAAAGGEVDFWSMPKSISPGGIGEWISDRFGPAVSLAVAGGIIWLIWYGRTR